MDELICFAGCHHRRSSDGRGTGQPGTEGPLTLPAPEPAHAGALIGVNTLSIKFCDWLD